MTKPDELNSVWIEKMECILTNAIAECMCDNSMTLECLDKAYESIKELYRKNAVIQKSKS